MQLREYLNAGFSGLWIHTHEPDEAQKEIAQLTQEDSTTLYIWDCANGMLDSSSHQGKGDPLYPLNLQVQDVLASDLTCLILLHNYHRFLNNPIVVQTLFNKVIEGKSQRTFYLILSPTIQIPIELEKVFTVVEHEIPTTTALHHLAAELRIDPNDERDGPGTHLVDEFHHASQAASGLTRYEAENAFALSIARHGTIQPEVIWDIKESMLKKSGLLTLYRGKEKFNDLGGLDSLKQFTQRAVTHSNGVRARGTLLLGVPGTGKSAFAKALGNETQRPTLALDPGTLMGSLVGQTEGNTRAALQIADAMSPCILFIDEIEKALSGSQSQHQGDSGVSSRMMGTLLTWLNDHESDVFVVATSNDVSRLPPEFSRAERWDAVFFIDLPKPEERWQIWQLYRQIYQIKEEQNVTVSDDDQWTGAEIKSCCRLAALLNVSLKEASQYIVPVAVSAQEKVSSLREWAEGRCIDASRGGIYQREKTPTRRRTVKT